jgi:hypothetical protein
MRTSYFIKSALLAVAVVFVIASCDKVTEPYVVHNQPVDTSACPAPQFPAVTVHYKRALLEDYTGHDCPNCPRAGLIASDLKEQYKDTLVVMAVHAGFFARTSTSNPLLAYDFRTTAGTDWDAFFKISAVGNPNGMVNRIGYPNDQQVLSPSAWANAVKTTIAQAPLMDLQLITEYNAADDKLCIHTKTSFIHPVTGRSLNLTVAIIEDSIVAPQKNSDPLVGAVPNINSYVHMHVLRGTVNGTNGTPVLLKENTSGAPIVKSYPVHLTGFNLNAMITKNCHVIAFIYDADTKEVLQAAETKVVK